MVLVWNPGLGLFLAPPLGEEGISLFLLAQLPWVFMWALGLTGVETLPPAPKREHGPLGTGQLSLVS